MQHVEKTALIWLASALALCLALNTAIALGLIAAGEPADEAIDAVGASHGVALAELVEEDSWYPMTEAYQLKADHPDADMYSIFFEEHIKFQYPPSSLLVLDLMPRAAELLRLQPDDERRVELVEEWITWPSRLACLLAMLASAWILELGLKRLWPQLRFRTDLRIARVLLALGLGTTFYPLLKSYELGQIQVFLNGFVALALLLMLLDKPIASGILIGICCLTKPQYGVVVLLALLVRDWRFAAGVLGTFVAGIITSIARFGFADHLRYLAVLQTLSRRGEAYWPNQSLNGLLNRFLGNGDAVHFVDDDFPPYLPSVYLATLACTLLLLGLAVWPQRRSESRFADPTYEKTLALAILIAAATIGSPVAWEHHYGTFLSIFALALPGLLLARPWGRWTAPWLAVSYLVIANAMLRPELLFANRWLGLLGSHLFVGSLILFGLLHSVRTRSAADSVRSRSRETIAPA